MGTQSKSRLIKIGKGVASNESVMGGYTKNQVKKGSGLQAGWTEAMLTKTGNNRPQYINSTRTIQNEYISDIHFIANGITVTYINCVVEPNFMYINGAAISGTASVCPANSGIINNTAGGNVVMDHVILRQKPEFAWWRLNGFHGRNLDAQWVNTYNTTDGYGIVGLANQPTNVKLRYCYVHDLCSVYWPSKAANLSLYDGTYLDDPEEHSDQRTHADCIQHHIGHSDDVQYCVLDSFANPYIGSLSLAPGNSGVLPLGYGLPAGMTQNNFLHPAYSLSGQNANFQATGQVVLLSCVGGNTTGGNYSYNWLDGAYNGGIHMHYGNNLTTAMDGGTFIGNRYGTGGRIQSGKQFFTRITSKSGGPTLTATTSGDVMDIAGTAAPVTRDVG